MQYPEVVLTVGNSQGDIRRAIKASGKTQEEAAAAVGVSPVTLSRWLNGHADPSFDKLEALALALDQPIVLHFGGTTKAPPPEWARELEETLVERLDRNRDLIEALVPADIRQAAEQVIERLEALPLPGVEAPSETDGGVDQAATEPPGRGRGSRHGRDDE